MSVKTTKAVTRKEVVITFAHNSSPGETNKIQAVIKDFREMLDKLTELQRQGLKLKSLPFDDFSRRIETPIEYQFELEIPDGEVRQTEEKAPDEPTAKEGDNELPVLVHDSEGKITEINPEIAARSFEELELSVRSYNCLKRAGLVTVGAIARSSEAELLRIEHFGRRSLDEVKEILGEMGIPLRKS